MKNLHNYYTSVPTEQRSCGFIIVINKPCGLILKYTYKVLFYQED